MPHVRAITTVLSELDVVAVTRSALLEDKYQLMLTAIKRSHSAYIFHPHAQVLQFRMSGFSSRHDLLHVPPVHTDVVNRPVQAVTDKQLENSQKEIHKLRFRHLSRGHAEVLMLNRSQSADVTRDTNVVGRIGEN